MEKQYKLIDGGLLDLGQRAGKKAVDLAMKTGVPPLSEKHFFTNVWDVVRLIPRGRVTSYGAIARYLGTGMSARMVGWAMNAAHTQHDVPAHRVVNRLGMLSGKMHFETPTRMQELLQAEGVAVEEDRVVDFVNLLWDPTDALGW